MEDKDFKKIIIPMLILALAILAFFIIKPLATAIFLGLLFAYVFYPLYIKLKMHIHSANWSAFLIVLGSLIIFLIPILLLTPMFIKQLFDFYLSIKNTDFSVLIFKVFPSIANSNVLALSKAPYKPESNSTLKSERSSES